MQHKVKIYKCGDCSGCLKASVCCFANDTGQQKIKKSSNS